MSTVNVRDALVHTRDNANLRVEWQALTQGAGVIHLSNFGILKIEGRDRALWLQKLVTVNIEAMSDGAGVYALLLEAKGHVLADFVLLKQPDSFLLYTSRAAFDNLVPNLRQAIFREKVTLADLSGQFSVISLQGLEAQLVAKKTFTSNFQAPVSNLSTSVIHFAEISDANHQLLAVHYPRAGKDGFDLLAPESAIPAILVALSANGARRVGLDALNVARVEAGVPWYGADFDETTLAPEARLDAFIAENKGCYPGQEVISRIRNLGHVNRLLVRFQIDGETVPSRNDVVFVDDKKAGLITSPVWSYARNAPLALGYIRREWANEGTRVQIIRGADRLNAAIV
jgi:folate-binding protein YgfZ